MAKQILNEIKDNVVKTTLSLDKIIKEYLDLANELEYGELTEELEERYEINKENIQKKMLGYFYIIKNNENKIESLYKLEIERLQQKIKKLENINKRLKDRCCIAAEIFGENNKYSSDVINVSSVRTVSLQIDESEFNNYLSTIKDHINNNMFSEDIPYNWFKYNIVINGTEDNIGQLLELIKNNNTLEFKEIALNIIPIKDLIKEDLIKFNSYNIEKNEYNEKKKDDDAEFPKIEFKSSQIKGICLSYNNYPRFS